MNIHMARPGPAGPAGLDQNRFRYVEPGPAWPGQSGPAAGLGAGCRLPGRPFFKKKSKPNLKLLRRFP